MLKRIVLLALVLTTLTPAAASAQLERPQPTTRSGAMIGDSYTFSWGRVASATWYEIWITDAAGGIHRRWTTAADAGCSAAQSASVCSMTQEFPLPTGNAAWWVQAWVEPSTYSGWGNGQTFSVVGRVPHPVPTSASSLTAFGRWALQATGGNSAYSYGEHVAIGERALQSFNTNLGAHQGNTALGSKTMRALLGSSSSAGYNTAVGYLAGGGLETGSYNTAVGSNGLVNLTTGRFNTAIGWSAGASMSSGIDNVYLASFGDNESNTMRLGNIYQNRAFISGVSGVTSAGGVAVYVNSAGQLGTATSSARFKRNVRPIDSASDRLFSLKPVAFRYNADIDPEGLAQYGLLAEDVEKQFPELLVRDATGKPQTVRYHLLVPLLLNEAQKHQALISTLSAKTADQERRLTDLAAQIDALTKILQNR